MKQVSADLERLVEHIDPADMLARTERWSAINSGTGNLAGLAAMAGELADAFAALPGEVSLEAPAPVAEITPEGNEAERLHGKHLVLRVRPGAQRRLLLTGHMDTVYPADHPFQSVRWLDEQRLGGPGTADMKGGIAVILAALTAFEKSDGAPQVGYDVLINSDEETGSLSSAGLIERLARGKIAALTYEPAMTPSGTFAHARGGSGNYSLVVTGRSAHAGRNPKEGRNAIVAAAKLAVALKALEHEELSVNPARIDGGSANNVVPDHAVLRFNIRPGSQKAAKWFEGDLNLLIEKTSSELEVDISAHGGITRPPKPADPASQKLFDIVRACCTDLGQIYETADTGGVCDGNNIAACGVPVVDTMGVRGGAIHSPQEFLVAASLKERAALSTLVLHRLATGGEL